MDCSPQGSSVHGTFQVRTVEWVAIFLLKGIFPNPGIKSMSLASPASARGLFTTSATWEALAHSKETDNMIHMSKTVSYFKRTHD